MIEQNEKKQNNQTVEFLLISGCMFWLMGKFSGETNWDVNFDAIGIIKLLIQIALLASGLWIVLMKRK